MINHAQTRNPIGNLPTLSDFEKTIGVTNQANSIAWYTIVRIFRLHMCNTFQQRFHVSLHVFWPTNCVKFPRPQFQEANCHKSAANPLTRCNLPKLFASVVEPCHGENKILETQMEHVAEWKAVKKHDKHTLVLCRHTSDPQVTILLMSKGMGKANISRKVLSRSDPKFGRSNPTTAFLQVVWSGHTEQPEDEGATRLQ